MGKNRPVLYNSMAYADDITVFSTNAKDLQRLIDMCTMYSDRWRFKYGIDKSKYDNRKIPFHV